MKKYQKKVPSSSPQYCRDRAPSSKPGIWNFKFFFIFYLLPFTFYLSPSFSQPCDTLLYSDGVNFFPSPVDSSGFSVAAIDNDSNTVNPALTPYGITSDWQVYSEVISPGDTNYYLGATSYFATPDSADNWLMFGGTTIPSTGAILQWQNRFLDNNYRDGYQVIINTVGNTLSDFINSGTVILTISDNDPSTNGDTVWTTHSVNIDSSIFNGQKVYIAFHHNAYDMFLLLLDNFLIKDCNVPCPPISLSATLTNPTTCSSADGSIDISPSGGYSPYSYLWSNGDSTSQISNLTSQSYSVTITDLYFCTGDSSFTLPASSGLSVSTSSTDETGSGSNDGTATAIVSGGSSPYTYNWSNGSTASNITNLVPGTYFVTVTDSGGCTDTGTAVVNAFVAPTCDTLLFSDGVNFFPDPVDSSGFSVAAIDNDSNTVNPALTPYGITSDWQVYSEVISPGDTNYYLGATSYFDTPDSADNWLMFGGTTIPSTGAILQWQNRFLDNGYRDGYQVIINTVGNTLSDFINNGTVILTISDNDPSTNGDTVWTIHSVNIDSSIFNGQKVYIAFHHNAYDMFLLLLDNFLIQDCSPPCPVITLSASLINPTTCASSDGSINISPSGGNSPYSYLWSNGDTTSQISNLTSQIYSVTVTDLNGCATDSSFTITSPSGLSISLTNTNETAPGANDGTATASVSGGASPFSYNWSNGQTSASATGLAPAIYSVTVTDSAGCNATGSIEVDSFICTISAIATATGETAIGANDGTATVTTTGGASPYFYLWSNNDTTSNITGLSPGTYSVTVTDENNCVVTASATVDPASFCNIVITSVVITNPSCSGLSDGQISITNTGGTGTLIFVWSNGSTGNTAYNLSAGTYSVSISDINNCSADTTVSISQPSPLSGTMSHTNETCAGCNDGTANVTVSGGTFPYSYTWTSGQTSPVITGLPAGIYSVFVQDANGCYFSGSDTVQPAVLEVEESEITDYRLQVWPNPGKGKFIISSFLPMVGNISIYDLSGKIISVKPVNSKPINGQIHPFSEPVTIDLSPFPKGIYFVKVESVGGASIKKIIIE